MLIALAVICALVESMFTALEVALGAVSRARLRALLEDAEDQLRDSDQEESDAASPKNVERLKRVLTILDDAPRTTLLFITVTSLSLWMATSLLTWQALHDAWPLWALILALVGVLFIAEVLPVLIAAPRAESLALSGATLVIGTRRVLAPLLFVIGGAGRALARVLGARENAAPQVTEDELRTALAAAEEEGAIESGERALLEGAMDFRARLVREVMTTRREIVAVNAQATLDEVLHAAIEEGHSRLPVYDGTLDKILGIVSTKDLIPFLRDGESTSKVARDLMRAPFFVPETKRIAPTLEELRGQRSLMALVVDDEGATVGLATLEDLLEEIVGEIQDEYDSEEPAMRVLGSQTVACDGGVAVRDLERFWEKNFRQQAVLRDDQNEDADDTISLAALALQLFDGVPREGDRIAVGILHRDDKERSDKDKQKTQAQLEIEVARMDGPRIGEVRISRSSH